MGRGGLERVPSAHFHTGNYGGHAGGGMMRKLRDHIAGSRWCLKRVWIVAVTVTSLITLASMSPMGTTIHATLFYPRNFYPRNLMSHEYGSGQFLWERQTKQMMSFSVPSYAFHKSDASAATPEPYANRLLAKPVDHSDQNLNSFQREHLPTDDYSDELSTENGATDADGPAPYIEDMVALPEDQDLFLVRHMRNHDDSGYRIVSVCRYGPEEELKSEAQIVNFLPDGRLAVTCTRPPKVRPAFSDEKFGFMIEDVTLEVSSSPVALQLRIEPVRWDAALVYGVQSTDEDVVLYAKGIFDSQRRRAEEYTELKNFRCVFGDSVETLVTAAALEVFRCGHPDLKLLNSTRVKVHMLYKGTRIPSVAYYEAQAEENRPGDGGKELEVVTKSKKKHFVCSCTMVWNVAKFLKEWVLYNSDLGVEKFFLYDNNSEDDIEAVVSSLQAQQFKLARRSWPWVKTQEAGFSHCAIEAQRECTWILFTDVDEYLFPKGWLNLADPTAAPTESPLVTLIEDTIEKVALGLKSDSKASAHRKGAAAKNSTTEVASPSAPRQVGQISFQCRNFGPSGRTTNPSEGVTQGYICREVREQRHKSLVYFPALKSSLRNVIHHFFLAPEYRTVYLDVRQAVVNHYKFQVWSEFATKFTKRASTYVTDWKEPKNLGSRDRPQGVGPEAKMPLDWESSHCAVNDTALRDYTRRRFRVLEGGDYEQMTWEL